MSQADDPSALLDARKRAKRYIAKAHKLAGPHSARLFLKHLRAQGEQESAELKKLSGSAREVRFRKLLKKSRIRELPAAAIVPGILERAIPLSAINEESGHPNHAGILYVLAIAACRTPQVIVEFGTFLGRTTLHLARLCPEAAVYTIDLPRAENPFRFADSIGVFYRDAPERARIHEIRTDSRCFDPADFRGRADVVWVDANHSYEFVRNDTEKTFEILAPGGIALWDDYSPDSIELVEYFAEFTQRQPLFRIRKTSVLLHIDGVDPLTFEPHAVLFAKTSLFKPAKADQG